jgi:signal transduction histidine kinase
MRHPAWQRFLVGPGHRLVGVFFVFVLLPGIVLGVFALRTLRQEGRLAQQQIQERLERITAQVGRDLDLQFKQWQEALQATAGEGMADPRSWPEMVRLAVEAPGSGVVISLEGKRLQAFPPNQLLYVPTTNPAPIARQELLPPSVVQAESLELGQKDYPRAIRLYQKLLDSSDAQLQPFVLQRLARSYRKAGRLDEAVRTYQKLEHLGPTYIGKLPSDLIARSELCALAAERRDSAALAKRALALYRDLAGGRWRLEKPRYFYYSDQSRSWIEESGVVGDEFRQIETLEGRKRALTGAVEELLAQPKRLLSNDTTVHFAFWQRDPFRAIVLSGGFLSSDLWPRAVSAAGDQGVDAALYSPDGKVVFGFPPEEAPSLGLTRTIQVDGSPWRLLVWPREPAALYADLKHRQNLYMGTLIFVVALLIFGSYITARTVKREFEVARMRADFVSTVSHEFRSPLTGIRQLGEMLMRGRVAGEERQRQYYQMIVQESERLGRLVENLLDFSRMEEGRKEYRFAPLNTSVWLRELVADFQSEIAGSGACVVANIPEDLPTISADGEALGCAVHNLLDNAVKYSPGSKTVWLDAGAGNADITISVRDRGVGIPERDWKHIFDKFYRVDGEISQKVKGAGLGLSLVRHIVAAHGGAVECESQVGEGSTFSIRLPAAPAGG